MRPAFLTTAAIWLLIISSEASAKIGETVDQCIARYGEPITKITDKSRLGWFRKTVYFIECWFEGGKCDHIIFRRVEDKVIRGVAEARKEAGAMAIEEVRAIIESMDPGKAGQWTVSGFEEVGDRFRIEMRAGLARAVYDDRNGVGALVVFSSEYRERWDRELKEAFEKEREFLK